MNKKIKDLYIIFGPPGSGKTIQANYMSKQLKLNHISWGYISRDPKYREKYRGSFKVINNPKTSDNLRAKTIAYVIDKEMAVLDGSDQSLVLDGFPRNSKEVEFMNKMTNKHGYRLKAAIDINPSKDVAYERCNQRFVCSRCKKYYDDLVRPVADGVCDNDGARLKRFTITKKEIDQEFKSYRKSIVSVADYLNRNAEISFSVSGDDDELTTFSNILLKLKNKVKNSYSIFERKTDSILETEYGKFRMFTYQSKIDYSYHVVLMKGNPSNKEDVLVRVHSSCITGDIFHSLKCDCGEQLDKALKLISLNKSGLLVYLFQEGRGINIINKIKAYDLQNKGLDTVQANEALGFPPEMRDYGAVRDILNDLGVKSVVLLSNNPDKVNKMTDLGIVIRGRKSLEMKPNAHNKRYLLVKKTKMDHSLKKYY